MADLISWFEIPVKDMQRAVDFYGTILGIKLEVQNFGGMPYTFLSNDQTGVGGALSQGGNEPSENGSLVYLSGGDDLNGLLPKIEAAGGRVLMPKTLIAENMGYMALFLDTEGNKVGLFSMH